MTAPRLPIRIDAVARQFDRRVDRIARHDELLREVGRRLASRLEYIRLAPQRILDVGCGRGEWLEVLKEAGLQAQGVDSNRVLVERCKSLSLDVSETEALVHLHSLAENTLDAVTAFHFVEHLAVKTLVRFLDEVCRALKPGGIFILETPNPENLLVGSCNFYLDPTHKHPIPIQTMELILEARGFLIQDVMKLHPVKDVQIEVKDQLTSHLNHFLYGPMNYAVVARKPEIQ